MEKIISKSRADELGLEGFSEREEGEYIAVMTEEELEAWHDNGLVVVDDACVGCKYVGECKGQRHC